MHDQDSRSKDTQHQIADAIRAKRERRSSSAIREELDAMEAALLADIESFDLDAMAKKVQSEESRIQSSTLTTVGGLAFPDIVAEGARAAKAAAPAARAAEAGAPGLQLNGSGLLDQLRHQAEVCQNVKDAEHQQLSALEARIDTALRQVFAYFHELVQQLNVIKPPVPRSYPVAGDQELGGLAWEQGFADYRTKPQSAGAYVETVSCNYRLTGTQGLVLERDGEVAERFRTTLFDFNLNVKVDEFRNERRYLERARFTVAPEVKVNIRWESDLQQGGILVTTRNLERLGSSRYSLPPDAINQALLDEFGRLILGQPNQFPRLLSR